MALLELTGGCNVAGLNGYVPPAARQPIRCELAEYKTWKKTELEKKVEKAVEKKTKPETIKAKTEVTHDISAGISFKAYMDYRTITNKASDQYKIRTVSETDKKGMRKYDNRYEVAIGTGYNILVGTYIDIVFPDGDRLPCIVADLKQDKDTDRTNRYAKNGSVFEFIVDSRTLSKKAKRLGDVSAVDSKFEGRPTKLVAYDTNMITD